MSAIAGADAREIRDVMVDRLKSRGLNFGSAIEDAFRTVPREVFLPDVPLERVYSGDAIATKQDGDGRPLSSSSEVGVMIAMAQLLDVAPGHRVLEIGAGTGYNAAILSRLVGESGAVTTVDIDAEVAAEARANLAAGGFGWVTVIAADGWAGGPKGGRFDRIEVTASVSDLSPTWIAQLADGGQIVFPFVLPAGMQTVMGLQKQGTELISTGVTPGGFMKLRGQGDVRARIRSVAGFDIELGDSVVGGADETLAALLQKTPRFTVAPPLGWEALTVLALLHGNISVSERTGMSFAVGIFDPSGSIALADAARDSIGGPFSVVVSFGSDTALSRLMAAIEETRKVRFADLRVVARPTREPAPVGEVVVRRGEFTFAFSTKVAGT
jgi:protein-L-isoaspartate(D-aspartate) O-methyltransferase